LQVGCVERNGDSGAGYESHLQGSVGGDTRDNIVRHTEYRCGVPKMEVGMDVNGGLGSKSKKWELVVGDTEKLGWFKKV